MRKKTFEEILNKFEGVTPSGQDKYTALCPSHKDKTASLSIKLNGDKILVFCHAGCATSDILQKVGLQTQDLFFNDNGKSPHPAKKTTPQAPPRPKAQQDIDFRKPAKIYSYTDEAGVELYQNCRYEFDAHGKPLPSKVFRQRHTLADGKKVWNLTGIRVVPFNLPELLTAARGFVLVEGEKDVETLQKLGLVATSMGKLTPENLKEFSALGAGKHITIISDNDRAGKAEALKQAAFWYQHAASVRIVCFSSMPEKSDVTDWVESDPVNHDVFALNQIIEKAPVYNPLQDITIDFSHVPNTRKSLIAIDGQTILSEGNIAGIVSGIGRGKSHLIEMFAAILLSKECAGVSKITTALTREEGIILVDSERTRDDCYYGLQRLWRRTGAQKVLLASDGSQFKNFSFITTSELAQSERRVKLLQAMETPRLKVLLIDGALDFVLNPNDQAECCSFADWLFSEANKHNIGILYTLHGNRNDMSGKGKGWLGDALQRKSIAFLQLKKHDTQTGVRVLTSDFDNVKVRHGRDEGINVAMVWSDELGAFDFIPYSGTGGAKISQGELFDFCFAECGQELISKADLAKIYVKKAVVSRRTAYNRINEQIGITIEIKSINGQPFYRQISTEN